jgi:NTE family protein
MKKLKFIRKNNTLILSLLLSTFIISSCANMQRHKGSPQQSTKQQGNVQVPVKTHANQNVVDTKPNYNEDPDEVNGQSQDPIETPIVADPTPQPVENKVGIILGPGAVLSFSQIGVIQELAKARIPIKYVVGVEMSSLVGAIYAQKEQPHDVEWQMFKIKEDDILGSSLIGTTQKELDITELNGFFSDIFKDTKVEDFKVSFACPSYNTQKKQTLMMSKGLIRQLLPYCMSYPPLWKPYYGSIASVHDVQAPVDFLRAKGINFIIYVNSLGPQFSQSQNKADFKTDLIWDLANTQIQKNLKVDYIIPINTSSYSFVNYQARRDLLLKGVEAGRIHSKIIVEKLGL